MRVLYSGHKLIFSLKLWECYIYSGQQLIFSLKLWECYIVVSNWYLAWSCESVIYIVVSKWYFDPILFGAQISDYTVELPSGTYTGIFLLKSDYNLYFTQSICQTQKNCRNMFLWFLRWIMIYIYIYIYGHWRDPAIILEQHSCLQGAKNEFIAW